MAPRQGASFVPLSPTINIPELLLTTPNFKSAQRVDARHIDATNIPQLQVMINEHVVKNGIPLVLENWHLRSDWPRWIFNLDWLKENHGTDHINIRDVTNKVDITMTMSHYLNNMAKLTSKFTPKTYAEPKQQRLYGKDLDCPPVWRQSLTNILPTSTFYLSPQADLMSSLPPPARAENMMCYVGHEGTYTPAHKEMCASLGQNIMVHTSKDGPNSEPGSSIWFMTEMKDRDVVREYWLGTLGHDIEVEHHFCSLEHLRNAPFTVYIVEQKVGDYILVPPLAPHQVWNRGTHTIKAAWNRTTVETLELAVEEALPRARLVCRDEQYKNKAIIYDTLKKFTRILNHGSNTDWEIAPPSIKEDYVRLFKLFNTILIDECFSPLLPKEDKVELIPNEYNVQCSFCRANIWNRFLSCKRCAPPTAEGEDEEPYDVCMECYASGRSCYCVSGLSWVEQHPWQSELLVAHADFRRTVLEIERIVTADSPKIFSEALVAFSRKPLARICQEALKLRPYVNPDVEDEPDDPHDIARKKKNGQLLGCHVCKIRHENWKCAMCTNPECSKAYCYGNLWRAFDMDPYKDVLAKYDWKCPFCLGICSCGQCKKRLDQKPYVPKGTILGAVTKHVADPRSVESLVDFARGNTLWTSNGVAGSKRRQSGDEGSEIEGEYDTLSKWGPTFVASAQGTPGRRYEDDMTEESLDDDNMLFNQQQNLYKADHQAAGLDVAAIPIDPALSGDFEEETEDGEGTGLMNANYAKLFENPPASTPYEGLGIERYGNVESLDRQASGSSSRNRVFSSPVAEQERGVGNLSTLEKNPLAFLAAAGLLHSHSQDQPPNKWHDQYGYAPEGSNPEYNQSYAAMSPSQEENQGKQTKGKRKQDQVVGDVDTIQAPEPTDKIGQWVTASKLQKKKKKPAGSLILVLRISTEAWRRWEADEARKKEAKAQKVVQRFGSDDVTTDLARTKRDGGGGTKSPVQSRKKEKAVAVSDDEDIFDDSDVEVMPEKSRRSARAGDLVEGLDFSSRSRARSSVGSTPRISHRRKSLVQQSIDHRAERETPEVDAAEDIASGTQAQMELDMQLANETEEEAGAEAVFQDVPTVNEEPMAEEPVDKSVPEPESEEKDTRPGSTAYKLKVLRALQYAKSAAARVAEGYSSDEEEDSASEDDNSFVKPWPIKSAPSPKTVSTPKVAPLIKASPPTKATTPHEKTPLVVVHTKVSPETVPTSLKTNVTKRPRLPPGLAGKKKIISGARKPSTPTIATSNTKMPVSGFTPLDLGSIKTSSTHTNSTAHTAVKRTRTITSSKPTTPQSTSRTTLSKPPFTTPPQSSRKRKADNDVPQTQFTRSDKTFHDDDGDEDEAVPALAMVGPGEEVVAGRGRIGYGWNGKRLAARTTDPESPEVIRISKKRVL